MPQPVSLILISSARPSNRRTGDCDEAAPVCIAMYDCVGDRFGDNGLYVALLLHGRIELRSKRADRCRANASLTSGFQI